MGCCTTSRPTNPIPTPAPRHLFACICRVGVDPWATFPSGLLPTKPHRAGDPAAAALAAVVARDGKLRLRHFSRVRQLGNGDVGMVDLVHLAGTQQRFALKSLEKREMLERNKVLASLLLLRRQQCCRCTCLCASPLQRGGVRRCASRRFGCEYSWGWWFLLVCSPCSTPIATADFYFCRWAGCGQRSASCPTWTTPSWLRFMARCKQVGVCACEPWRRMGWIHGWFACTLC